MAAPRNGPSRASRPNTRGGVFSSRPKIGTQAHRQAYSSDTKTWAQTSNEVKRLYNYHCGSCSNFVGKTGGEVHHRVPVSRGGSNAISNLIFLCDGCHDLRHAHMVRRHKGSR